MEIRDRIPKEMARILALPEVRERLVAFGAEPVSSAPAEVEQFAREYILSTSKLGEEIGINAHQRSWLAERGDPVDDHCDRAYYCWVARL